MRVSDTGCWVGGVRLVCLGKVTVKYNRDSSSLTMPY